MLVQEPRSAYQAKKDGDWATITSEIAACLTVQEVDDWWAAFCRGRARTLPEHWTNLAREACDEQRAEAAANEALRAMDRVVGQIAREAR